ncbi:MAG: MATE family efflux transporter [Oscillospiraceae bacterium]
MFSNLDLRKLILPLVIEQILVMTVGIADTMMISYAGEGAISGVSLVDMVNYLVITILTALATGGAVIVSQYLGSQEGKKANLSASQLLTASAVISTALMVICLLLHRVILNLLFGTVAPEVMEAADTYFLISALSFPFLGIYNASSALFRSMRRTNVTMYVALLMNVINVAGNAIGIFVLHAGVAGVAVPTLISRAVAAILLTYLAFHKKNPVFISWKDIFSFQKDILQRILRIAVPNGIENGLFALGRVLVTTIVALFGTAQIAANGVAGSIDMFAIVVVNAVNLAMVTVVGQCVGANEYAQAQKYIKKLMAVSYVSTGLLSLGVLAVLPGLLGTFSLSEETYRLSFILVLLHNGLAFLLHPTSFNLPNALRAAGDARFTMYAGIGSMLVFRLGSAVLFGIVLNMGIIGVWIAMGTDWLFRSILFSVRFKKGKWKEFRSI